MRLRVGSLKFFLGTGFLVGLAIWLLARLGGWPSYDQLDSYRSSFALIGGAALVADRFFSHRPRGGGFRVIRPDVAEIVAVGVLATIAVALVTMFEASPIVVALLVVVGAIALPSLRRRVRPVDALMADVRAQAAADGAEAERARLARELHDVPLQEVIAAIRQLEVVPGTEAVSDNLRALAGHLRNVAIDLRPPVLDDLGLPAALRDLAEEASVDGLAVEARLADSTTFDRASRPPAEIELAMYRIVAEAVNNSVRHAGASTILIHGEIGPNRVDLTVADNGRGLTEDASMKGSKHIGLSAMRRRAQAVDADLTIRSSGSGTEVHAEWHR
jgi:signal transduction histidine kinase